MGNSGRNIVGETLRKRISRLQKERIQILIIYITITTPHSKDFKRYNEATKYCEPNELTLKTLDMFPIDDWTNRHALDIGCGVWLRDTFELAQRGFHVLAVDRNSPQITLTDELSGTIDIVSGDAIRIIYDIPQAQQFHFVNAQWVLPLLELDREQMQQFLAQIHRIFICGGVFCGQFFGPRDFRALNGNVLSVCEEELRAMLELTGFTIKYFRNVQGNFPTQRGDLQEQDYYEFICTVQ